ncbi:MAG: asparagine synthase (glutamine-hydrolyzing) [Phycisphaerae bacterium]|nr:asparagine synthase (glutamine-hydrolyzing) [Phycisphaerae bacterium]
MRYDRAVDGDAIERMKHVLRHRGPDDEGTYISQTERCGQRTYVGLGHRRLSIIDLSRGARQPMCNEDGRIWVTYNGEIYNYKELRQQLEKAGHVFKTHSDTEVIVHAYEQWQTACVDHFNGMFAFAVWDASEARLFLARDRLGIKPLYYWHSDDMFVFGSELKALLEIAEVPRTLDLQSLSDYLSWQFIPAGRTVFEGVHKLNAGHLLTVSSGAVRRQRYWHVDDQAHKDNGLSEEELQERFHDLLSDSVKKRLMSDVPVGAFLSGGMDSAIIVNLMSRHADRAVEAFSIGFDSKEYRSELECAAVTAKACGANHHAKILSPEGVIAMLPKLIWHMDEPFADHSMVPTYLVSEAARAHVTVALSGDGADENFAGYPRRYFFAQRYRRYLQTPGWMRALWERPLMLAAWAAEPWVSQRGRKRLMKARDVLGRPGLPAIATLDSIAGPGMKKELLHADICRQVDLWPGIEGQRLQDEPGGDLLPRVLRLDVENYLANDILTKVDRMSMAHGLEVRVPMLDHRLVELAAGTDTAYKMRRKTTKYILRKTFADMLPPAVLSRKKQGFGIPVKFWMQKDLAGFAKEILLDASVQRRGLFNPRTIERMVAANTGGQPAYGGLLWAVMMHELWCRQFLA